MVMALAKAYVLINPSTGRVIESHSPSFQESRSTVEFYDQNEEENFEQDLDTLPLYRPKQRRIPAPEYYAQDGKTPIYKIFRKNPYGK